MSGNTDADLEVPPNAIVIQPEDDLDYPGTPPPCMSPVSHDVSHEEDLLDASTNSAPEPPGAGPDGVPGGVTGGVPDTTPDRVPSEPGSRLDAQAPIVQAGLSFIFQKQPLMSPVICT